jgi:Ni/Co efflux regulator RcnB
MKKLILTAIAVSLLASPLVIAPASAAPQRDDRTQVRTGPDGRPVLITHAVTSPARPSFRRWNKGQRFDNRYAQNYRVVNNWQQYRGRRLYAPPRGYHWVRSGNDAVLVAITGGLIGAVIGGAFN